MALQGDNRLSVLRSHLAAQTEQDVKLSVTTSPSGVAVINGELQYSVTFPEHLTPSGDCHVHRSGISPGRLVNHFPSPRDHVGTLHDSFEATTTAWPELPFLGTRKKQDGGSAGPYEWMTYSQAAEARTEIGSGLLHLGVQLGAKIGLYSVNCRDWVLVDAACHAYSMISVPLYDTLGPEAVNYICNHAELSAVACNPTVLASLLEGLQRNKSVKLVVVYGWSKHQLLPASPTGSSFKLITLEEIRRLGRKFSRPHNPPSPQDLALLCYTSGTTGTPKGAMLTHSNLVSFAVSHQSNPFIKLLTSDVHISYLPLAHIYERGTLSAITAAGGSIGFYRGDITELLEDVVELRPTVFYSVPRLYNRIFDRVMAAIECGNPAARALFQRAFASKRAALQRGDLAGGRLGPLWDRLVFSKVKARLGGRVRLMVSGASPLGPDVMDFLRVCFGVPVVEGYGLTESSSCCCATLPEETRPGHVGGPMPCVEVKLADIPDMKYTTGDRPFPRGEVCLRGYSVFKGYYRDEKNTLEAFDEDGWFHTGDVGMWLSGGRLKLIDRKKVTSWTGSGKPELLLTAMFKLAQGEYVAAEKIENVHVRSPLVAQSFVYGDSLRSKLVAVVVPDPETLLPWAASRDLPSDMTALCAHPAVRAAVLRSIQEEGRTSQLRGFEQVADIHLHPEPFSVENGLQTPTFKLKRPQAKEAFQDSINEMYKHLADD